MTCEPGQANTEELQNVTPTSMEPKSAIRTPHDKAVRAMELLKENGVLFGISVTYTRENVDVVTEDRGAIRRVDVFRGARFSANTGTWSRT